MPRSAYFGTRDLVPVAITPQVSLVADAHSDGLTGGNFYSGVVGVNSPSIFCPRGLRLRFKHLLRRGFSPSFLLTILTSADQYLSSIGLCYKQSARCCQLKN